MELGRISVKELITETRAELHRTRYTELSMKLIERIWQNLEEYLTGRGIEYFSPEVGRSFLEFRYGISATPKKLSNSDQDRLRAISLLADFQTQRKILKRTKSRIYEFEPQFEETFLAFIEFRKNVALSFRTIEVNMLYLERFGNYLNGRGIKQLSDVTSLDVIDFLNYCAAVHSISTIYCISCLLRVLFRYLYDNNITSTNLAVFIPKVNFNKRSKIPSAYSKEEVQELLKSVDRGNPKGKRDYAILLIAAKLGMRAGDICELTFDNFRWDSNTIEWKQLKTGRLIVLPLLNDVGEAVIDYIKYGRPAFETKHVFLRLTAPVDRMMAPTLHSIVTHYMNKAGIIIPEGKKHGPHSLRHSLASALLDNSTALPVISEILGHTDSDTTAIYLKIDQTHLRNYSLNVPPLGCKRHVGGF
jgi:site-specific recombinase XerD